MLFLVTCIREPSEENTGVEIVGIFDDQNKANLAKQKTQTWMEENDYPDAVIFVTSPTLNKMVFYEIEEQM